MKTEDELYEEATLAAYNLCCDWLAANGHAAAATGLAAFLNTGAEDGATAQPAPTDTLLFAPPKISRVEAREQGYTGDSCTNCQGVRMKIAGHCMVCEDCGTTTGCS